MSYELETTIEDTHVFASITGTRTRHATVSAANEIIELCRQHKIEKVLVDVRRLTGRLSIFDSMMLIFEEFPKLQKLDVVKKAAILDSKKRLERLQFFEDHANRRGYNIRMFTEIDTARTWLIRD